MERNSLSQGKYRFREKYLLFEFIDSTYIGPWMQDIF